MPARHNLPLRIYEQPHRYPSTPEEVEENLVPVQVSTDHVVSARNVDELRRKARKHLEDEGRVIRSIAVGPDSISAVVYKGTEQKDRRTMRERDRNYG